LPRRIDPPLPEAGGVRRHDARGRLRTCLLPAALGRHCRDPLRLAFVISAISHLTRLTRAGYVFAREGVFALVDPRPLPWHARTALSLARLLERPTSSSQETRLASALTQLGPSYVKLGQFLATRPDVVGPVLARDLETLQDKM